ncbi:uncharacterized protein FA14DRAFT_171792 [Meira miltonrushii]|uniref:Mediator of RNA polymerase II transcription subunit 4 n=1 Tax=Meira miltonrushii TaxID=1280837 RepID=A0A316VC11_9BASI|nr:uncharacterized protein FA14DRAFT_171792 [Meira miltonrushii]PWN35102.1 hypothetical protein FA14DRAFT_171792 [Meira miltonrushii]
MAMTTATLNDGKINRSNTSPPSLRLQLRFIKTIYQNLTNVYFLLIEQGASTSIASTKNALTIQMNSLKAQVRGDLIDNASSSRSQTPSGLRSKSTSGGLSDLRPEHSKRVKDIHLFEALLRPNVGVKGSMASTSTQNSFMPSLKQAIQAIEVINEILNELMERANVHAANQARIRTLVAEIEQRDTTMVQSIRKLASLRESCHRLVKLGKEEEDSIKRAESKPLAYDDILHYARTLSQTTTAPPGFKLQLDEEGERSHDADPAGDQPAKKRKLFQLAGDDDDEAEAGKNGQIPSHLQDKLPFPSIDAIRRGASVIRPPTWDMFQKGILQMDQEDVDGNPETNGQLQEQEAQYTRPSAPTSKSQPRKAQPVEEEEDGFGLDLN